MTAAQQINSLLDAHNLVIEAFAGVRNHVVRLKLARIADYLNDQGAALSATYWGRR